MTLCQYHHCVQNIAKLEEVYMLIKASYKTNTEYLTSYKLKAETQRSNNIRLQQQSYH